MIKIFRFDEILVRTLYILSFLSTLCLFSKAHGQSFEELVDSLNKQLARTDIHDTARAMTYINLGSMLYQQNLDTLVPLTNKGIDIAESGLKKAKDPEVISSFRRTIAIATSNMGFINEMAGDLNAAMRNYRKCLKVQQELGDKKGTSITYYNLGYTYQSKGMFDSSSLYFRKSIMAKREVNDSLGMPTVLQALGHLMMSAEDTVAAMGYYRESREIAYRKGLARGICLADHMLAKWHIDQKNLDSATYYYYDSYDVAMEYGSPSLISRSLRGVATLEYHKKNYQASIDTALSSLAYAEQAKLPTAMIATHALLAKAYKELANSHKAHFHASKAYELAKQANDIIELKRATKTLFEIEKTEGNYYEALQLYEQYINIRDSLQNDKNNKEIIRNQFAYQYEKQALADSIRNVEATKLKDAELATERAENRKQRIIIYFIAAIVLVVMFFVYMVVKSLRLLKVEKAKVDAAYDELDEKNTEILDSINYAKRIQSAILPPDKLVKEYLVNSFILYKPKDIVAGDFYWMEPFQSEDQNESGILFAAADCTGHGVPGAMVSVVCNNGLNRAVREYRLTDPGQILDKTREIVISEFEKSEEEVKDGMDIALCSLTFAQNEKQSVSGTNADSELEAQNRSVSEYHALLSYAGAHNPLWIVRNGSDTIEEIKADKQPIGKFDMPVPYTTHSIKLSKGDAFYIFSDGYADQFGGKNGKKFKAKNFKNLLLSIQKESMDRQKTLIDEAFESWKGDVEQLDDVCVIGVRI